MQSHERVKLNVRKRLEYLATPKYKAAIANNLDPCWFAALLNPRRFVTKLSTSVIDEAAHALGVPPHELLSPYFVPDRWPPPDWAKEKTVVCPTCGVARIQKKRPSNGE